VCRSFLLEHPGTHNQILLTWEAQAYEIPNERSHLEMFGVETPTGGGGSELPGGSPAKPDTS
jgi:hypothetical protein